MFSESGQGIAQVIIAAGIMMVVMLSATAFFVNQTKANNVLEFNSKREQLRLTLLGQYLNNPDNCRCLFQNSSPFPTAGTGVLAMSSPPTVIGRFNFTTPGDCATATVPAPYVTTDGIDFLKLKSVVLQNVVNISGNYSGDLQIVLNSAKEVLGSKDIFLKVPVAVHVATVSPTQVRFDSCSSAATAVGPALGTCAAGLLSTGYDPVSGALVCGPPVYQ